ncbi:MAG: AAA family ATPase [Gemmatimonas sp.]
MLLGPGKPLALLIFLACTPGRRASRESLINLLWSDVEPERARPSLRQTLFLLRRLLGEDSITGSEEVSLALALSTDRDAFLAFLEQNELENALSEYRGAFLPAFGVPGGAAFEQWADLERDRLESGFARGTETLVRRMLNESRLKDAKALAQRAREHLPQVEAAARLLIEAYIANGDFISAVMEADIVEQRALADETVLEVATRSAIARARRTTALTVPSEHASALVAELTGREREFFAITSAWDAVRNGPSRHFHLSAPAGFGKTRLLHDGMLRLAASGANIAQLRGTPGNRDVPYAFAADLAAELLKQPGAAGVAPASASALLALNPALSAQLSGVADTATGEEALRRRMLAIADLVHSIADEQRFVLAIDDLHWIDTQSFRMLEGLWSRLGNVHVLCLTASRPERKPAAPSSVTMTLAALDTTQVAAIVSALGALPRGAAWSESFVAALRGATRGSPLLILETLQLALDRQILSLSGNEWQCADEHRLASMLQAGEALRNRVRALPASQLRTLAALATAGCPLDAPALTKILRNTTSDIVSDCSALERGGFIAIIGEGWVPIHDEIAEAAKGVAVVDDQLKCERDVGEYFAAWADDDPRRIIRACQHLTAGQESTAVERLFRTFALTSRRRSDRRSYAMLAAELVGEASPRIKPLVRSLPWSWRLGLWSHARQAAAVLIILLVPFLSFGAVHALAGDELTRQHLLFVDSAGVTTDIDLRPDEFDGRTTPLRRRAASSTVAEPARNYSNDAPAFSPDGLSSAWTQETGDSTILDIWLRTPNGTRRLTRAFRDDVVHSWLPDGSGLVGTTNRWASPGRGDYDVAVYDTVNGTARQITHGIGHDGHPYPSPDGTRIAFVRQYDGAPHTLCVAWVDGSAEPECRLVESAQVDVALGWTGLTEIAIISEIASAPGSVLLFDWSRNTQRAVLKSKAQWARLSPDRKWIVAAIHVEGFRGVRDWIAPVDRPDKARPVDMKKYGVGPVRWWEGPADRSLLIDHIEFSDSTTSVMLGVSSKQLVRAVTAAGVEIPLLAPVRWTSSDNRVATVDSSGQVSAHATGEVTITASLVSWRVASKRIRVTSAVATTVVEEQWQNGWRDRWITFGQPTPVVAPGPGGVLGFFNRGDGVFMSVGSLRRGLDAKQGLGLEMRVSSPVTRTANQQFSIFLLSGVDTAALTHGDAGMAPRGVGNLLARCGVSFPMEGALGETRLAVAGGNSRGVELGEAGGALRTGAWWTLRLQIFPDGRCAVAINNRVVFMSAEAIDLAGEFRVWLGNSSLGTTILHGPLQVWTGVRTNFDWTPSR